MLVLWSAATFDQSRDQSRRIILLTEALASMQIMYADVYEDFYRRFFAACHHDDLNRADAELDKQVRNQG